MPNILAALKGGGMNGGNNIKGEKISIKIDQLR